MNLSPSLFFVNQNITLKTVVFYWCKTRLRHPLSLQYPSVSYLFILRLVFCILKKISPKITPWDDLKKTAFARPLFAKVALNRQALRYLNYLTLHFLMKNSKPYGFVTSPALPRNRQDLKWVYPEEPCNAS